MTLFLSLYFAYALFQALGILFYVNARGRCLGSPMDVILSVIVMTALAPLVSIVWWAMAEKEIQ